MPFEEGTRQRAHTVMCNKKQAICFIKQLTEIVKSKWHGYAQDSWQVQQMTDYELSSLKPGQSQGIYKLWDTCPEYNKTAFAILSNSTLMKSPSWLSSEIFHEAICHTHTHDAC